MWRPVWSQRNFVTRRFAMAKYRHRTFEMFDFKEEAVAALTLRSSPPLSESEDPESWEFQRLSASQLGGVIHVRFQESNVEGDEMRRELRNDFVHLTELVPNDSRVLLDFEGVSEFDAGCIEALSLLELKLKSKGSRMALCQLGDDVQTAFFPNRVSG